MGNFTNLAIIVLMINLIFVMAVLGIQSADPTSTLLLSNQLETTTLGQSVFISNGSYTYDAGNFTGKRPSPDQAYQESSTFRVPDWIRGTYNWITSPLQGLSYAADFIGAPYIFLRMINIPSAISAYIGALWGVISFVIILSWLLGRDS